MPSDSDTPPDGPTGGLESDGGGPVGTPSEELYTVVYAAVRDALLDVLATVFLLGMALVFAYVGLVGLLEAADGFAYVVSGGLLGLALVLFAAAFDLVPSFHERVIG